MNEKHLRPLRPLAASLAALLCACHAAGPSPEKRPELPFELIEGEPMYVVLPPDTILAIDEPRFVSAAEANAFLEPEEPVLGVVGRDGTTKCYSAWHLDEHEIVNDVLDGESIAATW